MPDINKTELSERDIQTKFITPAIDDAGWDVQTQIREEEYFTAGKIEVRGQETERREGKKADYILYYKPNIPLAVIEAKDNTHSVGDGMQQALDYAEILDVPFAFSSNGDAFQFHDRTGNRDPIEEEISLDEFPSPEQLWNLYSDKKDFSESTEEVVTEDYFYEKDGKTPRYYQQVAINRAVEAVARGDDRLLLVMATGTGKTFTAFQTIWRLWQADEVDRVLYLTDRNILANQAKNNDFRPFGDKMTKITNHEIDKAHQIYISLYQAITNPDVYKDFSEDFFDLVAIDECHRGSAKEDNQWREILEYFDSAVHLGMTATPKETEYVSNTDYFGDPIYTYTLRQGIEDGFLAPFKVLRMDIDKDLEGWRPPKGKRDKEGKEIEDRVYNQKDYDRTLVLEKRTELVAEKVTEYLKETDKRFAKTIIFCVDTDHAERMRQELVNQNPDLAKNTKYVLRITGNDEVGKRHLDNFTDPESTYPVIATTSQMLSTGVDAETCKLIVIDRNINSLTQFKQIIGRGTRVKEEYGKMYFTIMDFRKATEHFADPDFDGPPIREDEFESGDVPVPPGEEGAGDDEEDDEEESEGRVKYRVDDVEVDMVAERVQYYNEDGQLVTESIKDYTRDKVSEKYETLDEFLNDWTEAERKEAVIEELKDQGVIFEALEEEVGKEYDPFDLIAHVAFDQPPKTRRERAENVRKQDYFTEYGEEAREVLDALLDKYAEEGIENIEDMDVLKVKPLNEFGTPVEIIDRFGSREEYLNAVQELEDKLYKAA